MRINLKGKRVAIEKVKKAAKGAHGGIVMPEHEEYLGIVRLVGDESNSGVSVGQKVYFGTQFQQVRMGGMDMCVMNDDQVFAVVEE